MTGEEFIFLNRHALQGSETKPAQPTAGKDKKYVYGIGGIARLFGIQTAFPLQILGCCHWGNRKRALCILTCSMYRLFPAGS